MNFANLSRIPKLKPNSNYWHHSPVHLDTDEGTYMVTGATYQKRLLFKEPYKLDYLQSAIIEIAEQYNWTLFAWAVFPNHYHFIANIQNAQKLRAFITHLHSMTSREINNLDDTPGRKVWYQYWDTQITHRATYMARLKYVNDNPVRHGVVESAADYPWCSAKWFASIQVSRLRKVFPLLKRIK